MGFFQKILMYLPKLTVIELHRQSSKRSKSVLINLFFSMEYELILMA